MRPQAKRESDIKKRHHFSHTFKPTSLTKLPGSPLELAAALHHHESTKRARLRGRPKRTFSFFVCTYLTPRLARKWSNEHAVGETTDGLEANVKMADIRKVIQDDAKPGLPVGHRPARPGPEAGAPGAPAGPRAGRTGDHYQS